MSTTNIASQLRLAADIIETGSPWHLYRAGKLCDTCPHMSPAYYAANCNAPGGPYEIRLAPSTPWPEAEKRGHLAAIRLAHEAGKPVQYRNANSSGAWSQWHDYDGGKDMSAPMPIDPHGGYREWRVKPEAPPFLAGDKEREAFEEWAKTPLLRNGGSYDNTQTQAAWAAWQAARKQPAS